MIRHKSSHRVRLHYLLFQRTDGSIGFKSTALLSYSVFTPHATPTTLIPSSKRTVSILEKCHIGTSEIKACWNAVSFCHATVETVYLLAQDLHQRPKSTSLSPIALNSKPTAWRSSSPWASRQRGISSVWARNGQYAALDGAWRGVSGQRMSWRWRTHIHAWALCRLDCKLRE